MREFSREELVQIVQDLNGAIALYDNGRGWCRMARKKELGNKIYHCLSGVVIESAQFNNHRIHAPLVALTEYLTQLQPTVEMNGEVVSISIIRYNDYFMGSRYSQYSNIAKEHALEILKGTKSMIEGSVINA